MLLSPTIFDSSVVGIYWALLGGGTLFTPERDEVKDVQLIAQLIEQHRIDTILCLPTYYRLLLDGAESAQLSSLKRVILAGEACNEKTVDMHYRFLPNAELYNEYGPTECTVWSSVAKLAPEQSPVTIGQAIPGTEISIVDTHGYPVPTGTIGEIVVSGPGVADGYWLDEKETAKRFFTSLPAFDTDVAFSCYRTGDLGSYTHNSQLLFHGRVDRQIKVRGHRIEPAEIENIAASIPAVRECVAVGLPVARSDGNAENALNAIVNSNQTTEIVQIAVYLTTASELDGDENGEGNTAHKEDLCVEVLERIENTLPAYMHPSQVLLLEKIPKTVTGKFDLVAMQSCEIIAQASKTKQRSGNTAFSESEKSELNETVQNILDQLELVAIDVLQVSNIFPDDTFYELGGDSIAAIMFVSRAREKGVNCDINQLASKKSFGSIAIELAKTVDTNVENDELEDHFGPTKLTPIQQWYFSLQNPKPEHWNIAFRVSLNRSILIDDLSESITNLLNRFPAIGSRFTRDENGWSCDIPESVSNTALITTLASGTDSIQQLDTVLQQIAESWRLETGWLIGFVLVENELGHTDELYLMVHHLVLDHIAVSLLVRHILSDCGYLSNSDSSQATVPMSLRQYARMTAETEIKADSSKWATPDKSVLNDSRPFSTEENSDYFVVKLTETDTSNLLDATDDANVNVLEVLVTVLSTLWRRYSGQHSVEELELYVEASRRELTLNDQETADVIGWLTLFHPVDNSSIQHEDILNALKNTKNSLRGDKESNYQYLNWYFEQRSECPTIGTENTTCLINYVGDSDSFMEREEYTMSGYDKLFLRDKDAKRAFDIELNAQIDNGQLLLAWHVVQRLDSAYIQKFSQSVVEEIRVLSSRLRESEVQPVYTPSDFSAASLSQEDIDKMMDDLG